jgi:hypothetical protein
MEQTARIVWAAFLSSTLLSAGAARGQDWAREMFDHTSHDFGTVARGAKVEHSFGVENIYLEDAHIKSARASCGCTTPEVPIQILKTWKKAYLVVKVDTIKFQGQKDVTITVEFDKPYPAEVQLYIHCYIRSDVVLDPGSVHLNTAQGQAAQQRVNVRYAGRPDWQILQVESANPNITGKVVQVARINGLVTYDLTVNLAAGAKAGYSRDELNLVTNDPNPRAQRVPVTVEALVVAPVTVHPSPLIMEPVAAGKLDSPVMRPLVVVSSVPFRITSAESTDPRFRCDIPTGAASAAATVHRLPVLFLGGDLPGKLSTRIRIQTTAATDPIETEVNINLTQPAEPAKTVDSKTVDSKTVGSKTVDKSPAAPPQESKPAEGIVDPVFGLPSTASKPRTATRQDY